jgi:tetratricopeptide (TPR) repeat protein
MMEIQRIVPTILFSALTVAAPVAMAGSYEQQTIPLKWLQPLVPENAPEPNYPDYDKNNTLEKARAQVAAGEYRRALVTLGSVKGPKPIDIALLKGEACLWLGRPERALGILGDPAVADDPSIITLRARVLASRGDWAGAIDAAQQAIAKDARLIAPRYYLGFYKEQQGDIAGAKAAYQWFMDPPQNFLDQWLGHRDSFSSAEVVTYIGRALDRWATLNMAYQTNQSLHNILMTMFVRAYDVIDTRYWAAHQAAAEYFVLHDDPAQAFEELQKVFAANPYSVEAWALGGKIAIAQYNFDAVDQAVMAIRQVNPDSIDADLLQARNYLLQRVPKLAMPALQRVLAREPKNIEALGLLAGTYALLLQDDKSAEVLKQADAIEPTSAMAYYEIAEQLSAMRQYPRAIAMYKIAVERAPWWAAARNGLGLIYTQSGDEDDSRITLDAAHEIDPFNVRTTNYLRLLDQMDKFTRKESAHFVVIYDAQEDPIIPEYFSDYLESIYTVVCGEFHYEPKVKTLIEVFPTHDAFSVRTTGAPWIATVGASTGRVIAMVAPRKGEHTLGPFNWAQVLRHEFTHTVTLGQTDNRIAHWFTEGLAVQQEHSPVRWEWVPMLYQAVTKHELFKMDELTWGFIRPRRPIDRQLAYAESSWICQYIEQTYGHDAILQMLEQFRLGHGQDEVFQIVLHKSETDFFAEFSHWCEAQVAKWGYDAETSKQYADLRGQAEKLVQDHQYAAAVPLYEKIVQMRPVDLLPHQRLAGLYLNKAVHEPEKTAEQLDILAAVDIKNNMYTKGAARVYLALGKLDLATERARTAVYIDPYDMDAHKMLADLYEKSAKSDGLDRENRVIEELQNWLDRNNSDAK